MIDHARYPKAVDREAEKAEGRVPPHPSDRCDDPPGATLADQADAALTKKPVLKHLGGSEDDAFNIALAEATRQTAWITSEAARKEALMFVGKALAGIAPRDEMEGMLAAQMVSMHLAAMECMRRAMIAEQPSELRATNLKQGTKCSQTYAALLDALSKNRNKGHQKVVVEHVHVYPGGQAIVGRVEGGEGRGNNEIPRQSHAKRLAHTPSPLASMWGKDAGREPVPIAGDEEREMPDARRHESGRSDG